MLRALRQFNRGITSTNMEGQNSIKRVADMFVDDCDLWIEPATNASDADLVRDFTTAAQA